MIKTKLVVLRGPSGSGKSTTAKNLFEQAKPKVCLIEQDYYRYIFKPAGGGSRYNSDTIHRMIKNDVLLALEDGYNVILEGILSVKSYDKILDEIFSMHSGENYMYYFDISFDETVRRHATRTITRGEDFGQDDMREWYPAAHRSNHRLEKVISESSTLEETVARILSETGL